MIFFNKALNVSIYPFEKRFNALGPCMVLFLVATLRLQSYKIWQMYIKQTWVTVVTQHFPVSTFEWEVRVAAFTGFLDFVYPFYVELVGGKTHFNYNDLYTCGAHKCSIGFFWNTLFT